MKWSIILLLFSFNISFGQSSQAFNAADLAVEWEVVENNYGGKREFLSAFTFKTKSALPKAGWRIYFNFPRMIASPSVTGGMTIRHINGDFYELSPTSSFAGLSPSDSLWVSFVAGAWAISISDAPAGLYIVWNDKPTKGSAIANYTVKPTTEPKQYMRYAGDMRQVVTPQITFEQNSKTVDIPEKNLIKVFPSPAYYKEVGGQFDLANSFSVKTKPSDGFASEAAYLEKELRKLLPGKKSNGGKAIHLIKSSAKGEAYGLNVTPEAITISAGTPKGIFWGIQSLKTLIPPQSYSGPQTLIAIPTVSVVDSPRFGHRAFMLDVARNFHSKAQVLKVLDLMSLYKLNVFHFHFSDDEGWRLEIPGLPELTQVGARRAHAVNDDAFLHPSFGSGPDFNAQGTGYYSKGDFIEILKYAKERHIEVIPEIETPGHARAAVAAMRARYNRLLKAGKKAEAEQYLLYHPGDTSVYKSVQRWYRNVMDPSLPSTYAFLEKVADEIRLMYKAAGAPLRTIHFGGDEVPGGVWKGSPAVKSLMQKNTAVKTIDDLWYYFFGNINNMLKRKGLFLYGWEEIAMRKTRLDGKPFVLPNPDFANQNIHVDVWNNVIGWGAEDLPYRLANAGYKVVLSPVSNMYFDLAYEKSFYEPGYYWGGYLDADKPFYFIPFDYYRNSTEDINGNPVRASYFNDKERLTDYGKQNIPGVQGLLWSETLKNAQQLEYMLLPKLLSLAERAWAKDPDWTTERDSVKADQLYKMDWSRFANVLGKRELSRLDHYAGGFDYRIPTPGAVVRNGSVSVNTQYPGLLIRYTTDGTEPSFTSSPYVQPITMKGRLKIRLFNMQGRGGRSIEIVP